MRWFGVKENNCGSGANLLLSTCFMDNVAAEDRSTFNEMAFTSSACWIAKDVRRAFIVSTLSRLITVNYYNAFIMRLSIKCDSRMFTRNWPENRSICCLRFHDFNLQLERNSRQWDSHRAHINRLPIMSFCGFFFFLFCSTIMWRLVLQSWDRIRSAVWRR